MSVWNLELAWRPGDLFDPEQYGSPRGDLSLAFSRKLTFSLTEPATLTFNLPGNHPTTGQIVPLRSDVLAFRDGNIVQRFRVVSRVLSKSDGVTTAQFGAVSYKALFDAAIFHEEYAQYLNPVPQEQTLLAWNIIEKAFGTGTGGPGLAGPKWIGITGRRTPAISVTRSYPPPDAATAEQRSNFFDVGQTIRSGIDSIANAANGFEWDIVPHPTGLPYDNYFLAYQKAEHGRDRWWPEGSPLRLLDGGSVLSWSHTVTPEYANVIRFTGNVPTAENIEGGATSASVWVPSTKFPTGAAVGRWEKDVTDPDQSSTYNITSAAQLAADRLLKYTPEITVTLARGVWDGPDQLWVGDSAQLLITEPVAGIAEPAASPTSEDYVLWINEIVRVVQMDITIDDLGAEDVELSINRPKLSSSMDQRARDNYVQARNRR
jgi:hypothetical protein